MTDLELLELAAKAAGYGKVWNLENDTTTYIGEKYEYGKPINYTTWNPLTDDGDALRLAVKLHLNIECLDKFAFAATTNIGKADVLEDARTDPYAATRRAIVRAAADIGKDAMRRLNDAAEKNWEQL